MSVKSLHCDNISQEFDDSQFLIVKEWIEKRDSLIESQKQTIQSNNDEFKIKESELNNKITDLNQRIDELTGNLSTVQKELEKRKDNFDSITNVKARRKLERLVSSRLDSISDDELDSLSDRDLKEKVIKSNYDFDDLNSRSDEQINGMFDMAIKYSDQRKFDAKKNDVGCGSSKSQDEMENFDMLKMLQDQASQSRSLLFGGKK